MTTCSVAHDEANTPAPGTAPRAGFWVALEQNGAWGPKAAEQSHLDPELGRQLTDACKALGGTFVLIRNPASHADVTTPGRRIFLGYAGVSPWLLGGEVTDADLADHLDRLDLAALSRGDSDAVLVSWATLGLEAPLLLVCTNGQRDQCCAVRGRRVAAAECEGGSTGGAQGSAPVTRHTSVGGVRVWESSHLGGHRFAPTALVLPFGRVFGRLEPTHVAQILAAADSGLMPAELLSDRHDRGFTRLEPAAQVAEHAVRAALGDPAYTAFDAELPRPIPGACASPEGRDPVNARVTHRDGRAWEASLRWVSAPDLPESCGEGPLPTGHWTVSAITPLGLDLG